MKILSVINIKFSVALSVFFFTCSATLEGLIAEIAPSFSIVCTLLRYLTAFHVIYYQWTHYHRFYFDRSLAIFFIIYSIFVLYYITIGLKLPFNKMLAAPESVGYFVVRTLFIFSMMLCARTILENISVRLIVLIFVLFCLFPALFYINAVGFDTFQVVNGENINARFIGSLTIAYNCAYLLILIVVFYRSISRFKILNVLLLLIIMSGVCYVFLASTKRGPILWSAVSLLVCYYFNDSKKVNFILKVLVCVSLLYVSGEYILDYLSQWAPYSIERIRALIYEGDTSHRLTMGENDNGYILALKQFAESPVFGSYFRLIPEGNSIFRGAYPHNIILEVLISMGIVGLVPFVLLLLKAFKYIRIYYVADARISVCFILFIMTILSLMTTGSICLNETFWISFALVLVVPKLNTYKIK